MTVNPRDRNVMEVLDMEAPGRSTDPGRTPFRQQAASKTSTRPLRALIVDDGSRTASAVLDRLNPQLIEITRAHASNAAGKALETRCREADAVVFVSDGWDPGEAAIVSAALRHLLSALGGSGKRLVYVSDTGVIGDTGTSFGNEDSPRSSHAAHAWRCTAESNVHRAISSGVRSVIIRASLIHGDDAGALLHSLIDRASYAGEAVYVGDGSSVTSTIHIDDLATLIESALLRAPEGAVYMAASDEVLTWREIAAHVGRLTDPAAELRSMSVREATELGLDGMTMAINATIRDDGPHRRLGWSAVAPTLASDLASRVPMTRS